jgi:hypothetical protein
VASIRKTHSEKRRSCYATTPCENNKTNERNEVHETKIKYFVFSNIMGSLVHFPCNKLISRELEVNSCPSQGPTGPSRCV